MIMPVLLIFLTACAALPTVLPDLCSRFGVEPLQGVAPAATAPALSAAKQEEKARTNVSARMKGGIRHRTRPIYKISRVTTGTCG